MHGSPEQTRERRGFFSKMQFGFQAVSRPPSLYSRQSIVCLRKEVKPSAALSMFAKHFTRFGLTVCFIPQNWVSTVECGQQLKTCTRM